MTDGRPDQRRDAPPRLVSVVVPCRHAGDLLARQLECLAGQDYAGAWEVVLADNTPHHDVATITRRFADRLPALRVADASGGSGASYARNVGVAEARGDFLAFCDADDEVDAGWIANLVEAGAHYDLVGGAVDELALNDSNGVAARAADGRRHGPAHAARLPTVRGRDELRHLGRRARGDRRAGTRTTRARTTSRCRGGPRCAGTRSASRPRPSCLTATARRAASSSASSMDGAEPTRNSSMTSDPSVWRGPRTRACGAPGPV